MIESVVEFKSSDLLPVIRAFCTLPQELRPTHFSFGESEPSRPIVDTESLVQALASAGSGPMLTGHKVEYSLGFFHGTIGKEVVKSKAIRCVCFIDVEPPALASFFLHLAKLGPAFGFACAPEELQHRNRVVVKQGCNVLESWVGRNIDKYVPGLYWMTLISDGLARTHKIPIAALKRIANEYSELDGGQHLFRFFERPQDWRDARELAAMRASIPGVFDIDKIRPRLQAAENFLSLSAALKTCD